MEVDHSGRRFTLALVVVVALAAPPSLAGQLSVVSQNLQRLFDDIDDGNDAAPAPAARYRARLDRAAEAFAVKFSRPHLVAVQEVENSAVLRQLAETIRRRHGLAYRPVMAAHPLAATLNTGYLVHPRLAVRAVEPLFANLRFNDTERLFSRPPLRLDLCHAGQCVTVLNLHLRSMRGIGNSRGGRRIAAKRRAQAQVIAAWVDRQQRADPQRHLMLLGDFNALTPSDRHVDVAGIIRGAPDNAATRLDSPDLVARNLVDLTRRIPRQHRYSYIYRRKKQQLDYLFASRPLAAAIAQIRFHRIDYALSDHAALYARFRWP